MVATISGIFGARSVDALFLEVLEVDLNWNLNLVLVSFHVEWHLKE